MDSGILVTGGTGALGHHVVWRLLEDEHDVRVFSRHGRPASDRTPTKWRRGDLRTGRGLDAALDGVRAIAHCATTRGRHDVAATRRLVEAARRAGRPHLVFVSIVGIDRVPGFPYYRVKRECERIVEESGLPWTLLRATQFHELVLEMTRAQRWLPVALAPGGGVSIQPVAAREVGERIAELVTGAPAGRVPDLGGPEVREAAGLVRAVLAADHRRRAVVPLRLPGRSFREVRQGALLAPEHAVGRVTFEEFLAEESRTAA
ncbi:NAD(P)H-binding protein [Streptomyces sp. B6B3]|uniref:SDR family oxidoreductase n=1 Tax=Streptomyces sp. B6B3 TaxID=3153570 RepID=UPI00325E5587